MSLRFTCKKVWEIRWFIVIWIALACTAVAAVRLTDMALDSL